MPGTLDLVFSALSDPTRRRIMMLLIDDDMAVTDIADPFGISLAAVSKHLNVLARSGLILRERRGRVIWCKLDPDGLREASVWLSCFGLLDPLDLDGIERFLRAERLENETHDGEYDDDEANDVDYAVHETSSLNAGGVR
jgi:DNA-binding transcriptional ArsR family regulator